MGDPSGGAGSANMPARPAANPGMNSANSAVFRKTLSDTDLILFAGLSGDLHPAHIDDGSGAARDAGGRTIHGVFLIGLMSTAVSRLMQRKGLRTRVRGISTVRFHAAARPGDTVEAVAWIAGNDDGAVNPSAKVIEIQVSAHADTGTPLADGVVEVELS